MHKELEVIYTRGRTKPVGEFLSGRSWNMRLRLLSAQPDERLFNYALGLEREVGFFKSDHDWYIIKGYKGGIKLRGILNENWSIGIHTHPICHKAENDDGSLPSLNDLMNTSANKKTLIVSPRGITEFFPPTNTTEDQMILALFDVDDHNKGEEYRKFLDSIGAQYRLYKWSILSPEKLKELLS